MPLGPLGERQTPTTGTGDPLPPVAEDKKSPSQRIGKLPVEFDDLKWYQQIPTAIVIGLAAFFTLGTQMKAASEFMRGVFTPDPQLPADSRMKDLARTIRVSNKSELPKADQLPATSRLKEAASTVDVKSDKPASLEKEPDKPDDLVKQVDDGWGDLATDLVAIQKVQEQRAASPSQTEKSPEPTLYKGQSLAAAKLTVRNSILGDEKKVKELFLDNFVTISSPTAQDLQFDLFKNWLKDTTVLDFGKFKGVVYENGKFKTADDQDRRFQDVVNNEHRFETVLNNLINKLEE